MGGLLCYNIEVGVQPCSFVTSLTLDCRIVGLVSIHNAAMPLHIACMYHLSHLHSKLFILAHEMVDREPENPISWYAVGVWYLSAGKWNQARQYFRSVEAFILILDNN